MTKNNNGFEIQENFPIEVIRNKKEIPLEIRKSQEENEKNLTNQNELIVTKSIKEKVESKTVNVFDVSSYILLKLGELTTIKLQKLVYYCQAWSLVWDESPLFSERIEAWANGPVIPDLFFAHKGFFRISNKDIPIGNLGKLTEIQKETINSVLDFYGNKSAQWLVSLSHMESPWMEARRGIPEGVGSRLEIPIDSISEYYSSLM